MLRATCFTGRCSVNQIVVLYQQLILIAVDCARTFVAKEAGSVVPALVITRAMQADVVVLGDISYVVVALVAVGLLGTRVGSLLRRNAVGGADVRESLVVAS